jgi:YesN/AraC family two-component response regulator
MDDYITKPVKASDVFSTMEKVLRTLQPDANPAS